MARKNIVLTDGGELDPARATLTSLTRLSDDDLARVLAWVDGERFRLAERAAEIEQQARERVAAMRPQMETAHEQQAGWARKNL
jgi:hypothetical protein